MNDKMTTKTQLSTTEPKKVEGWKGACLKDTWTKPKGGRIEDGRRGWVQQRGVVGGKWRQLYLNNNKKEKKGFKQT